MVVEKEMFLCQSLTGTSDCCFFHRQCHRQVLELRRERNRRLVHKAVQISATCALICTALLAWFVVVQLPPASTNDVVVERRRGLLEGHPKTRWSFTREHLRPDDIFISVKTSRKFHRSRLDAIVKTWFQLANSHTWFFTDAYDKDLTQQTDGHLIVTDCPSTHSRQALCCKMAAEFDAFLDSGKRWFCHFDDDNYVNVPALVKKLGGYDHRNPHYLGKPSLARPLRISEVDGSEVAFSFATGGAGFCLSRAAATGKMLDAAGGGRFEDVADRIRLPDDVTMGYVAEVLAGIPLETVEEFHSHLEAQAMLKDATLKNQISFSYSNDNYFGDAANTPNVLSIPGKFSLKRDPTRFMSLHCMLFPSSGIC